MKRLLSIDRLVVLAVALSLSCSSGPDGSDPATSSSDATPTGDTPPLETPPPETPPPAAPSPYDALPAEVRSALGRPFTGDLDQMVERRLIRAGVVFNRTQYFIDEGVQRGMAYEALRLFEDELNERFETGSLAVHVAFVPMSRDALFPALVEGTVDLVAATLTITPERQRLVDFSNPTRTGVAEIVVSGPAAAPVSSVDDLSGQEVFVRRSSSYYESLVGLNESLASRGLAPVKISEAPEALEDDDLLEMVNAGLVSLTIVDDFVAEFWSQVFPAVRLHREAAVRSGGSIGVAVRKTNPELLRAANLWIEKHGPRTAFGNIVERRYLGDTKYVTNATEDAERRKFDALARLFRTYADRYDVDYLLMAAQGYQESRLEQSTRSRVGAIGVMQIMPATGRELEVGNIEELEPNIHGGVKYMRRLMDQYLADEPIDPVNRMLLAFASYNAGPGRIRQLRRETAERGLDPNVWFGNVERITSERIGRETVQYVSNIFKYYVAYRLTLAQAERRRAAESERR